MASYLAASIKRSYAESFLNEMERNENQYFFFVGKGTTWAVETSPPGYTGTVANEYRGMNEVIGYKKLNPSNIIFALPRYEWTSGTTYDQYDDAVDLFDDNNPQIFYVVTDEDHIYKCLYNAGGSVSTVKPSQILPTPFSTSDGYRWQYLATVKESNLPYELTDYVPVEFAVSSSDTETQNQYNTQQQAVNASITRLVVENSGGASAGIYNNAISEDTIGSNSVGWILNVSAFSTNTSDSTLKTVTFTEEFSRGRISAPADINDYVGYIMRVNSSDVNPNEIGNYGVITAIQASGNSYIFTVKNDVNEFVITPSQNGLNASVEILPYIKIVGNGSDAYAYPKMNLDKNIVSATVVNGGRNYSSVLAEVISPKDPVTVHPTIRAVLSPKGGHGSNILKELNVKDVLIIVEIREEDSQKIIGGGSYRQFGIIKNPVLSDGTGTVAGKESPYYRDITMTPFDGVIAAERFDGSEFNSIIGSESSAFAKVVSIKSQSASSITLKTINTSGKFITKQDRPSDYTITTSADTTNNYLVGELVSQLIPAGTNIGSGISYSFPITSTGRVLSVSGRTLDVRLTSSSNFVVGVANLVGGSSSVSKTISTVSPRYGEYVYVTNKSVSGIGQFVTDPETGSVQKLYKIIDTGLAYFDQELTPAYRGLHVLNINTSVSSSTGAIDVTSAPLTQNSFSNGDVVHQGVTGQVGHYATGVVYYWDFQNSASGKLYLTNVLGSFKNVAQNGLTGSTLGAYIVSSVDLPEIDQTSGEILYIDNVRPIQRAIGQEEEFRLRLGF